VKGKGAKLRTAGAVAAQLNRASGRSMTPAETKAVRQFFDAVEKLKKLGVVRSDKYLGDIAEFICSTRFKVVLATSGREPGHDGLIGKKKVQIKFHGGKRTTIDCGNPAEYDELIIILGPKSVLRATGEKSDFVAYRIPSDHVAARRPHADGKLRYTKNQLPAASRVDSSPARRSTQSRVKRAPS
jgi:hypothetical protein